MSVSKGHPYNKTFTDKIYLSNSNLQRILKFFLFECPVPGTSVRGKKFVDYGIEGKPAFSKLKKEMLASATTSLKDNYKPCTKDELKAEFESVSKVVSPDEYCVFLKHDAKTVMQSLYSAIRNAFAHGSFCVKKYSGTRIYFMSNYDNYLKAEIVLHEATLLGWINCIINFADDA